MGVKTITTARLRSIEEALYKGPRLPRNAHQSTKEPAAAAAEPGCESCGYLDSCPEEYRQEAAGWCENWERGAT